MKKMIHHLRRQPESTRRHILHVATIVAAVVLLSLWIISLGTSIHNVTKTNLSSDLKPFSAIKDNLVGGYKSISEPDTTENVDNTNLSQ